MSDRPDDISKEAWEAAEVVSCVTGDDTGWLLSDEALHRVARAIDQARREGYAAGVGAAAEVADDYPIIAELLPLCDERENSASVIGQNEAAEAIAKSIRALDGKGGGV